MQTIVRARESPLAQEQWVSMKKQCREELSPNLGDGRDQAAAA
jgi:hypothetical protein